MALDFSKVDMNSFGVDEGIAQEEQATAARATMTEAVRTNPDQFAKINKLAKESNAPVEVVESDPVEIETKLKLSNIDFSTMSKRNPNTASFLVDFNNATLAQDDIDTLTAVENILTPVADTARALPAGFVQSFGSAFEGAGRLIEAGSRTLARGADALLPESADPYIWLNNETPEALKMLQVLEPQRALRYQGSGLKAAAEQIGAPEERQNIATDISGAIGNMGGQIAAYLMNPTAALGMTFAQGADIQGEKQEATGTEGRDAVADAALVAGGMITAGTEKLGLDALLNRIPPQIKNDILRNLADVTIAGGIEAVQEVTESIAQSVLELYTTNPDAEIFEGLDREAIAAGGAGAIVRAVVNAMVPGRVRSVADDEAFKDWQGQVEQQKIDQIAATAEASKLRARDHETFKQFVAKADGDQNTTVFIDGPQAALYLQSKRPDEIANDPALQLLAKGVQEASALGVDVAIPVPDFAATVAGTPAYADLREHMTMSQESVSPFRQEQVRVETENFVQRLIAGTEENVSEYAAAQDIYTQVRDQLIDTGMVNARNASVMAQVVPAWATAYARRQGISVADAFARSGLKIEGPQTGELSRLSAEALAQSPLQNENFKKWFGDSKVVDAEGKPLVVYHGTGNIFTEFSNDPDNEVNDTGVLGEGFYFTTDKNIADSYARMSMGRNPNTLETYLKVENPIIVKTGNRARGDFYDKMLDLLRTFRAETQEYNQDLRAYGLDNNIEKIVEDFANGYENRRISQGIKEMLQSFEYDSVIYEFSDGTKEIVVFEPTQIKSAIGNNGQFDPTNPSILKQGERGYYDPQQNLIRLTEAADLSTFLHEFAHFMYEMELRTGGEIGQSINNWFKRNAEAVAKEANSYIGVEGDLAQSPLENENFKKWFGDSKVVDAEGKPLVVYHGSSADIEIFDTSGGKGKTFGTGSFFTSNSQTANTYTGGINNGNVTPVYLNLKKPAVFDAGGKNWNRLPKSTKVNLPAIDVDDQADEDLLAALLDKEPVKNKTKKIKSKKTTLEKLFPDEFLYDDYFSTDDLARWARNQGYDGVIINNVIDQGPTGILANEDSKKSGSIYVAFNPEQIKSAIGNNGQFDPTNPSILKQSTVPTGEDGSITAEDVIAFLDNNTTGDQTKDAAIRRATHEQFARGFETYLMEGEAPSIELRNAFRTFARWLTQIYKSIRGQLNVTLDNEARQFFDRLLATEDQIAAAEARARYEPMFTDAAMAGMSETEFADYKKRQEKIKDKETETLRDKLIKQLTRQTKQWWREEKNDLIRQEVERLNAEPVYAARSRLTNGDIKLDHATVKAMVGETFENAAGTTVTRIPVELKGMTAKGQQGVHPDVAAGFFGFSSGSELINALITTPKILDAANVAAEQIMIDRHGDILNDGTIEREADEAVQNEERGKLIFDELKALGKGTSLQSIERATIKNLAEQRIGRLSFREIHPGKYRKAEIRAAQESAAMLVAGNREGAAQAKTRQLLNYYLGMAATDAKNQSLKIVERMARYNKKDVREEIQKAEGGYWEQIVKILERFEFRKSATLSQVDQRNQDINTWMQERINNDGDGLVLSPAVLNESYVTHWKNVPFADLQGINDSVKNIEHVARYANKITRLGEQVDFKQLVDRWVASMDEKATDRFITKRTDIVEGRNWGRWAMSQMTKIPYLASWLDGGERVGVSHDILVQPFTDAYSAELKLWEQAGAPVMAAIEGRSKEDVKRHNTKIFIPEINDNLYGHQVLAVALNTGNESNLRKMLLGEGWADPDNEAEINFQNPKLQAVLRHMTKSDWELVQMIWDQMETLYPQLAEVHRRTTGLIPPKIDANPVTTPYGTFKGGYYPVKYDPNRGHQAALNEEKLNEQTESMFSGNNGSIQASVNAGATNERTKFYAPIRLSLDVVPSHFQEAIHYITHHDPVRETNRLIRNKQVADTIKAKLGPEEYAQLKPWLNDVAKDGREAPTKMFWDSLLQNLRLGVTLGTMGFKASTGIIQISGLSNTIGEVGLRPTMQAMRTILGSLDSMKSAWDFAKSNSKVLEFRAENMDREIKAAMRALEGKTGPLAAVQQASMKHIALIQTYMVDLPSWHAAYIKSMDEHGDEARAYKYADWVIENVQGSGATKDLARIMRNQSETGRMFTMFMTFFSALWNLERDLVKGAKSGRYSVTAVAAKVMFLFTIPVLFDMLMKGELGGEDDDDESQLQKVLTKVALYPLQSVPFMRDIANSLTGEFGYNISPLASILEQGTRTIPAIAEAALTDEEITESQAKGATKFVGAVFKVPGTSQAWATGEHLYDVMVEGEDFSLHELLFGPEKK